MTLGKRLALEVAAMEGIMEASQSIIHPDTTNKMMQAPAAVPVRTEAKVQRNEPCPCGSKLKYKHCCLKK